jgi:hypothetical protein
MDRIYSTHWETRNAHTILIGNPGGKRPISRHIDGGFFKVGLIEIGCESVDWIQLAQNSSYGLLHDSVSM